VITSDLAFCGKPQNDMERGHRVQRDAQMIKIPQDFAAGAMVYGRTATFGSVGMQYYSVLSSNCRLKLANF
jgi:hypothetical protein